VWAELTTIFKHWNSYYIGTIKHKEPRRTSVAA
jgi:hypothetical protein